MNAHARRWTAGAFGRGVVTLAGDAAHPMTPNLGQVCVRVQVPPFGPRYADMHCVALFISHTCTLVLQGGCVALEDAVVLGRSLGALAAGQQGEAVGMQAPDV